MQTAQEMNTYVMLVQGNPRVRKEALANHYDVSVATVSTRLKEMEKEIEKGRYPKDTIIRDGKIVWVNVLAFDDFLERRKQLQDPIACKHTPEYSPGKKAESWGWNYRALKNY